MMTVKEFKKELDTLIEKGHIKETDTVFSMTEDKRLYHIKSLIMSRMIYSSRIMETATPTAIIFVPTNNEIPNA